MADLLVETWRRIIVGEGSKGKSWVLFKHGTCVTLASPVRGSAQELAVQATALMKEWGPVVPGTPAGDFDVIKLQDDPGWVVTSHHPDVRTYVGPDELGEGRVPSEVIIGLIGRAKRHQDAEELEVVHTEP